VLEETLTDPGSSTEDSGETIGFESTRRSANPDKIALIVAGVHRSGTSALTRVLNLLGATLPDQILPPGRGNERGFWEPRAIVELNDEILWGFGSDWFDIRPLPEGWFQRAVANGYIDRIMTVLESSYHGSPFIVIKDPRIARLAPLYFAALDRMRYMPRMILPVRHPSETAASLHGRNRPGQVERVGDGAGKATPILHQPFIADPDPFVGAGCSLGFQHVADPDQFANTGIGAVAPVQ
jgi:hypothetical protein